MNEIERELRRYREDGPVADDEGTFPIIEITPDDMPVVDDSDLPLWDFCPDCQGPLWECEGESYCPDCLRFGLPDSPRPVA
jgi:hypothetical protein